MRHCYWCYVILAVSHTLYLSFLLPAHEQAQRNLFIAINVSMNHSIEISSKGQTSFCLKITPSIRKWLCSLHWCSKSIHTLAKLIPKWDQPNELSYSEGFARAYGDSGFSSCYLRRSRSEFATVVAPHFLDTKFPVIWLVSHTCLKKKEEQRICID